MWSHSGPENVQAYNLGLFDSAFCQVFPGCIMWPFPITINRLAFIPNNMEKHHFCLLSLLSLITTAQFRFIFRSAQMHLLWKSDASFCFILLDLKIVLHLFYHSSFYFLLYAILKFEFISGLFYFYWMWRVFLRAAYETWQQFNALMKNNMRFLLHVEWKVLGS